MDECVERIYRHFGGEVDSAVARYRELGLETKMHTPEEVAEMITRLTPGSE